jgi:hypothetical protein
VVRSSSEEAADQGEIGDGRGHERLEPGFEPAKVASLTDAELDEAGDPMLDHLPLPSEEVEPRAPLPRLRPLQKGLVGVEGDGAPLATWGIAACP